MELNARIYVAGHRGLAGSALVRRLASGGFRNLLTRTHAELELTDQAGVRKFFEQEKPAYVFVAAAKVGGILANNNYPAEFIQSNLSVQINVMHEAWRNGVRRLLFLGSSCIYPRDCPQPIKEEYLLTGPLEFTNRAYAVAKIAGVEMCRSYNRQYGTRYLAAMPTNLYGLNDTYDLEGAHVLPALIRKMHEAKAGGLDRVVIWGTGSPRREFLYSDDMADACVMMMNLPDEAFDQGLRGPNDFPLVNVGCGEDQSIADLDEREVVGAPQDLVERLVRKIHHHHAGIGHVVAVEELPPRRAGAPDHHAIEAARLRFVHLAYERRQH